MSEANACFPNARAAALYHYCRMQLPALACSLAEFNKHLQRTYDIYVKKTPGVDWATYLDQLYLLDWYLCCGCLKNDNRSWEMLFATRTGKSDCLLIDALRARAVRLYPRDEEKQEGAVSEFWAHLIVADSEGSVPIMARYDGQRPLAPWLIRVFQNRHLSKLRSGSHTQALPEDEMMEPIPPKDDTRWHEPFCRAAREWLDSLTEQEIVLLGLRWRYRLSQRDIATLLKVHEGTISRQTDKLRDRCLEFIGERLTNEGWTGDDISQYILTELDALLVDEPKMSAHQLRQKLSERGISLPS